MIDESSNQSFLSSIHRTSQIPEMLGYTPFQRTPSATETSRSAQKLNLTTTGVLRTHNVTRALYQYRRGNGFESRSGLNVFQALISLLLKLCV